MILNTKIVVRQPHSARPTIGMACPRQIPQTSRSRVASLGCYSIGRAGGEASPVWSRRRGSGPSRGGTRHRRGADRRLMSKKRENIDRIKGANLLFFFINTASIALFWKTSWYMGMGNLAFFVIFKVFCCFFSVY